MARILVVDDDFGWRALYRLELGASHEVVEAADPVRALHLVEDRHPDLILLDYHMPGMAGDILVATLRSRGVQTPVIFCTSDPAAVPPDAGEAVVSKHTDLRRLRRTIERVLGARHASDPGRAA
jgi:CheY-like chemotaxis protein